MDKYDDLVVSGYDFIELPGTYLTKLDEYEFRKIKGMLSSGPVKCHGINSFLPPELKIVGTEVDETRIREYISKFFERAQAIDVVKTGLGSPVSRIIPEGFSKDRAKEQLKVFIHYTAAAASDHGIKLLLEPVNKEETNLINTVDEAMEIIDEIGNENIGLLLDIYHFMRENEKLTNIDDRIIKHILHMHIASKDKRAYPTMPDPTYVSILMTLRKAGYDDTLSIEASYTDFSYELKKALILLKALI
jgi:D-psicose/D-tagatose/L-ribulose 3-epimerase